MTLTKTTREPVTTELLRARYAWARHAPEPRLQQIVSCGSLVRVPAGASLFLAGDPCRQFVLVLKGAIRVHKQGANGKELLLYRVGPGESCIMTTACLLGGTGYSAAGVVEEDLLALALPREAFLDLIRDDEAFRLEIFELFAQRMSELMALVESVAFLRLDRRIAHRLLGHGPEVRISHQQLAQELGSAREFVSRVLKNLEDRGLVRLGRGRIVVLDAPGLRRVARQG